MKFWKLWPAAAALAAMGVSGAQAASVICGDPSLGVRTVTVNPADPGGLCYAGLQNLGDPQLITLMDSLVGADAPSTLVDRDTGNANGGDLNITGVGGQTGGWSVNPTVWGDYGRVFLYFHFGDGPDNPGPGSTTDPDIFIVELLSADVLGTWSFSGQTGLSNIALIGADADGNVGGEGSVPEPGTLALIGLGLLGAAAARRRPRA